MAARVLTHTSELFSLHPQDCGPLCAYQDPASAAMTLDTYADLFDDDDVDYVASALSRARKATIIVRESDARDADLGLELTED